MGSVRRESPEFVVPKPSVAFISGSKEFDGVFRANFQVFRATRETGFGTRWIQCIDPSDSEGNYTGGELVRGWRVPLPQAEMGLNRLWVFPSRLWDVTDDRTFLGDPTFVNLARGPRASRTIVYVHDLRPLTEFGDRWTTKWMFRYALPRLRNVRRIVVATEFVRSALEAFSLLGGKTFLLPPHTETTPRRAAEHVRASKERLAQGEEVRVVYVATDRPHKNVEFFFRLAKALETENQPRFQFTLISRLRKESEAVLQELRPSNLAIVPFAPEVGPFYWTADVCVFPSLYEGFGLPMLEALSYGVPVIANDREPMREVLGNGGLFAPAQDLRAWKEALLSLSEPHRYEAGALRAADQAQVYSHDRFVRAIPGVFE